MEGEVDCKPESLRVADEPDPEQHGDRYHNAQEYCSIANSKDVTQDGPGSQRCQYGKGIANWHVRQEIPAFPHEEISTTWTTLGAVEISLK